MIVDMCTANRSSVDSLLQRASRNVIARPAAIRGGSQVASCSLRLLFHCITFSVEFGDIFYFGLLRFNVK